MGLGKIIREFGVKVNLGFDAKAAKAAKASVTDLSNGMKSLGKELAAVSAAMFGTAAIAASHSKALQENSAQLGVNVEALQELEYAAKVTSGVGREELMGTLQGISQKLFEARNNNQEAAASFKQLGISVQDIADPTMTADKLLVKMSQSLSKLPDGMYKTGLAAEVGLDNLLPLVNRGAEGIRALGAEGRALGAVLDASIIKRGAKFQETLNSIWTVVKNITYIVGDELIQYLQVAANEFLKWIAANKKFLAQGIAAVVKQLGIYLMIVLKTMKLVAQAAKALTNALGGVENVAKALSIAFGLFASFRILSMIGMMAKAVLGLKNAMMALNFQAALIGAAMIALVLVIQDLFSDDSIILEFFYKIPKLIEGVVESIKGMFTGVFDYVGEHIKSVLGAFGGKGLASMFSGGGDAIKNFMFNRENAQAIAPKASGAATTNNSAQNNMNATINVAIPPGTTAKQATDIVSKGVDEGFKGMMRNTRNQALGGVAY